MPPLWQYDQDLFKAIHVGLHRDWLDPVMSGMSFSGLGYIQAVPLIIAGFLAKWPVTWRSVFALAVAVIAVFDTHSPIALLSCALLAVCSILVDTPVARCALAALIASGVFSRVIVELVPRQRPSVLPFSTPLENVMGATSFPSGHSTTTFAIVAVLCWRYARTENAWLAWAGLAWAALVGLSRVYVGVHYPLDVLAGALLGTAFGSACYWLWLKKGWMGQEAEVAAEAL